MARETLAELATQYRRKARRTNPPNELDDATRFVKALLDSGRDLNNYRPQEWADVANKFHLNEADFSNLLDAVAQWI